MPTVATRDAVQTIGRCRPAADRGAGSCAERVPVAVCHRRRAGCDPLGASRRAGAGGGVALGGFLLTVIVDTFDWPSWLAELSPFAHLALVPATAPNCTGAAGMMGVSVLLAGLGIAGFARRDLRR
jgi:hypothetical protein